MHDEPTLELLRVLVVEDNPDTLDSLVALIHAWGHVAHGVLDSATSLQAAIALQPHVIIVDIKMPVVTGWELVRILKRIPALRSALFVALTARDAEADRHISLASGCHLHMVKPADPNVLEAILAGKRRQLLDPASPANQADEPWKSIQSL